MIPDLSPRTERIVNSIEQAIEDAFCDGHNAGYDEAWDEARNKGYDEGWEDACQYILDNYLQKIGFIHTPTSPDEIQEMIETQANPGLILGAIQNYLYDKIRNMKVR